MQKRGKFKVSVEEKEKLAKAKVKFRNHHIEAPGRLKEHMQAFNDAVLAIIMTIIVLEIQPPLRLNQYGEFVKDIIVFLITFFIIGEFWYSLHRVFDNIGFKPGKVTVILDFGLLADLSLMPVMTKWIMASPVTFAVINFGIIFLIAQVLSNLVTFFGTKALFDSTIIAIRSRRVLFIRLALTATISVLLIGLAFWYPSIAMVLYLSIPIISFFFPTDRRERKERKKRG